MPVRLAGLWSPSGGHPLEDGTLDQMLFRFPAESPWVRSIWTDPRGLVIADTCGGSSACDARAESVGGDIIVAGTIRLDGRQSLEEAMGDARPPTGGDAGLVIASYRRWGVSAFGRISGDFAFVLWDRARD